MLNGYITLMVAVIMFGPIGSNNYLVKGIFTSKILIIFYFYI